MRKVAVIIGSVSSLIVVVLVMFGTPDSDVTAMRVKYGGSDPSFAKTSEGLSVHYRDQGCQHCPAILLLHGSNSSLQTFEPLVRNLQDRYRLISYDQPGHGLTGPHPRDDYSAQGMFEAIAAVVEATGIEQFAIAGNSMGGWVAWRYALARPEDVSALILIDASGAPSAPNAEKPKLYLGARIMRWSVGRILGQLVTPRFVIRQSLLDSVADETAGTEEMVERYWELLRYPGNRRAAGLLALVDRETSFGNRLSEVTAPTLILWGAEDRVIPPHNAGTFQEMIPDSELQIFDGVGHLAMEEAPKRTARAIDQFLSETQLSEETGERGESG